MVARPDGSRRRRTGATATSPDGSRRRPGPPRAQDGMATPRTGTAAADIATDAAGPRTRDRARSGNADRSRARSSYSSEVRASADRHVPGRPVPRDLALGRADVNERSPASRLADWLGASIPNGGPGVPSSLRR